MTEDTARGPHATASADDLSAEDRKPKRADLWIVAALAAGSMIFSVLYFATGQWPFKAPLWVVCLASAAVAAPLIYRRRFPSQVAWIQAAIYVAAQVFSALEPAVSQIALFMGIYSIGAWQADRRKAFISRLLLCISIFVYAVLSMSFQFQTVENMSVLQIAAAAGVNLLTNAAYFGGGWIFGNRAWRQRRLMAALRAANEEVRQQEQQLTRQALDLERVRIARELHDGVAHHIAGVGIHAAAARRSLEKNPDKAKESLQVIESSARETVDELRALVYTLRDTDAPADSHSAADSAGPEYRASPGSDASPASPGSTAAQTAHSTKGNPSLGDLPELIESARRFSQRVGFTTIGTPRPLTPITEMSIYRVIQESLTNCSRYAGTGAEVEVRLRYGSTDLEVEVSDARPTGGAAPAQSADAASEFEIRTAGEGLGLGIVGMRERMNALGGSLEAGPKSRGGWLVRARIPYPRSTPDPSSPDSSAKALR